MAQPVPVPEPQASSPNRKPLFRHHNQPHPTATATTNDEDSQQHADTVPLKTRTSVRFSTYSMAPSFTPTVQTSDSAHAEIRDIASGLERMENKALTSQRVLLSEEKTDTMSKLALGAKLERALERRMSGQDAEMRPRTKVLSEKLNEKSG